MFVLYLGGKSLVLPASSMGLKWRLRRCLRLCTEDSSPGPITHVTWAVGPMLFAFQDESPMPSVPTHSFLSLPTAHHGCY